MQTPTTTKAERIGLLLQFGMVVGITVMGILTYWDITHPKPFDAGWNACVAEIRKQSPEYVWPLWIRNVSLQNQTLDSDTPDTALDA